MAWIQAFEDCKWRTSCIKSLMAWMDLSQPSSHKEAQSSDENKDVFNDDIDVEDLPQGMLHARIGYNNV